MSIFGAGAGTIKNRIAQAFIEINADTSPFAKQLQGLQGSIAGLAGLTVGIGVAAGIAQWGKTALDTASEFVEAKNRFDVVFGGIRDQATKTAEVLQKQFDLSDNTIVKMMGHTGDLLTGFGFAEEQTLKMTAQVVELAAGLTSLTDAEGGVIESSKKLTSAIMGQTRAAMSLGVKVNQKDAVFRKNLKILTETHGMTQVQARAELILAETIRQSVNALGDYERTRHTFANQQRRLIQEAEQLNKEFGLSFLSFVQASGILDDLNDEFSKLSESMGETRVSGFTSALGALAGAFERITVAMTKTFVTLKSGMFGFNEAKTLIKGFFNNKGFMSNWINTIKGNLKFIKNEWSDAFADIEKKWGMVGKTTEVTDQKAIEREKRKRNEIKKTLKLQVFGAEKLREMFARASLGKTIGNIGRQPTTEEGKAKQLEEIRGGGIVYQGQAILPKAQPTLEQILDVLEKEMLESRETNRQLVRQGNQAIVY